MSEYIDGEGNTFHVKRTQDVEPVLDLNKAQQAAGEGASKDGVFWHVGRIPTVVLENWAKEAGVGVFDDEFEEVLFRKLNDPDFRSLRVKTGRV